jgi:hypothetical protein
MKKKPLPPDELLDEHDFSSGIRGKYAGRDFPSTPSPLSPPLTLGVDPGLNRTGYAILERGARGPICAKGG